LFLLTNPTNSCNTPNMKEQRKYSDCTQWIQF
jgi:hypothetical protein